MKKILLFLLAAPVAALLVWLSGIIFPLFSPPAFTIPEKVSVKTPEKTIPGTIVTMQIPLTIPANCKISGLTLNGSNIIPFPVRKKFSNWAWNKTRWEITAPFKVLSAGKNDSVVLSGDLEVLFGKGKNSVFSIKAEPFEVTLPEIPVSDRTPQLSPDISAPANGFGTLLRQYRFIWISAAVILLVLLLLLWIFLRKRKADIPLITPWEIALGAIGSVVTSVRNREILPETGFIRLSDIIRNYLEIRFKMPLSKQTTAEFMRDFLRKKDYLPDSQKPFLENFMNSADLIKFAKASSSTDALDEAALRAEKLINATVETVEKEEK